MSLSDGTPMMTMPVAPANGGNSGGFGWGGDGAWLIILFLIIETHIAHLFSRQEYRLRNPATFLLPRPSHSRFL